MASADTAAVPVRSRAPVEQPPRSVLGLAFRWVRATDLRTALAIGGFAFVLRLVFVLSVQRHGFGLNDTAFYDLQAEQLADGNGYTRLEGPPTAAWPPGWPFLLSIAFRMFGSHEVVGQILNAIIGAATVSLLFFVALRAFDRRSAVFCAFGLALLPGQIYLTDLLLSETLDTFLLVSLLALLTVVRPSRPGAVVVGLLIGCAALTRGENLLLIAIPLAVWWPLARRVRLERIAIVVVAAAVVVAPWTIRNVSQMGSFVLVSTNGGQTLYSGHNPTATGGPTYAPSSLIEPSAKFAYPKRELEQEKLQREYAKRWALDHPAQELLLIPKRFLALIGDDGAVVGTWINSSKTGTPAIGPAGSTRLAQLAAIGWYALLSAFVFALVFGGVRQRFRGLTHPGRVALLGSLAWIGVSLAVYCLLLFGQWRYHIALEPLMLLIAAPVVTAIWSRRRDVREQIARQSADESATFQKA